MSRVNWRRLQNRYVLENTPIPVLQPREGPTNSKCRIGASRIPLRFERWLGCEKRIGHLLLLRHYAESRADYLSQNHFISCLLEFFPTEERFWKRGRGHHRYNCPGQESFALWSRACEHSPSRKFVR